MSNRVFLGKTMKTYTSQELADEFQCARITVLKWAQNNGVKYIGEGKRKIYIFTEEDRNRFNPKPSSGRPVGS
jgi:hypothetical protein